MTEPNDYSELFNAVTNIMNDNTLDINARTLNAFRVYSYQPEKVIKLKRLNTTYSDTKETMKSILNNIQSEFDKLESYLVLYCHYIEKVNNELNCLADKQQNEMKEMQKKLTLKTPMPSNIEVKEPIFD